MCQLVCVAGAAGRRWAGVRCGEVDECSELLRMVRVGRVGVHRVLIVSAGLAVACAGVGGRTGHAGISKKFFSSLLGVDYKVKDKRVIRSLHRPSEFAAAGMCAV